MTRAQAIRAEVLFQLYAGKSVPVTADLIERRSKRAGQDYTNTEIRDALYFLKGQGFAEAVQDVTCGVTRYRITSAGMLEHEKEPGE